MVAPAVPGPWRRIVHSEALRGLLLVGLVLLLHAATDAIGGLDRLAYDLAATRLAQPPSDRIAIVAIDEDSLERLGPWPWRHALYERLLARLAEARPRAVALAVPLFEAEDEGGLAAVRGLRAALAQSPSPDPGWALRLAQAEQALDADGRLARQIAAAGNVLLLAALDPGETDRPPAPAPAWALRGAPAGAAGAGQPVRGGHWPLAVLGQAAAGTGHLQARADADGTVRGLPLLLDWNGQGVPSLALLAAARGLNLAPGEVRVRPGQLLLGRQRLRMDEAGATQPLLGPRRGGATWPRVSAADLLEGRVPSARLAGRLVLVGPTAPDAVPRVAAPGQPGLAPVELLAEASAALMAGQAVVQPAWAPAASFGLTLLVAVWVAAGLPRLRPAVALWGSGGLLLGLLGGGLALLWSAGLWVGPALPAVALLAGHAGLATWSAWHTLAGKLRAGDDSAETHRLMGLALQGQGQLDKAFGHFRQVPLGELVMDNLYHLGLDFERRRHFGDALAVYEHIATHDAGWRDLAERIPRTRVLAEVALAGAAGHHPGGSLLIAAAAGVEKPMLGRYLVEKELGKGAMGIVYQGRDPKIGRVVAIKTLALSSTQGEADDARDRFFAEAEIAGRLQHPHIVTVFDAGEEYDLAYIAMEFLRGGDLAGHCRAPGLLPLPRLLSIIARVAEALAYAHRQGVIHRDIKPANLMWEPAADTVKITDFGIARAEDSNRTRTGVVLGTPSYMSPEQVAGQKLDGRSDLYSLGVTLYQMLGGALPFRGETLPELVYKIGNAQAPDLCTLRPDLPGPLQAVVERAMAKRPGERFADGDAFAAALRAVMATLDDHGPDTIPPAEAHPGSAFERTHPRLAGLHAVPA